MRDISIEKSLLSIILINDILDKKLTQLNPVKIKDRNSKETRLKSRLKNSNKSSKMLCEIADEFFELENLTELFGDVADVLDDLISAYIENRLRIQGKHFISFPDGITSKMFREIFDKFLTGEISLNPELQLKSYTFKAIRKKDSEPIEDVVFALNEKDATILFKEKNKGCIVKKIEN
jgi:hypothetical protein